MFPTRVAEPASQVGRSLTSGPLQPAGRGVWLHGLKTPAKPSSGVVAADPSARTAETWTWSESMSPTTRPHPIGVTESKV